jgi:hypothetical protein
MDRRRRVKIALACLTVIAISSEIGLRLLGAGSYPLYDIDDEIKYIPSANQHGTYFNRYAWHFNDRHMASRFNWSAEKHPNLVLVGNSIVLGGNTSKHDEKLGALLEKELMGRYIVWPVAAGGWSNVNEMAYLDRNADVLQNADAVIIEFMEGGLSLTAPWPGYDVFPDERPWLLTAHIVREMWLSLLAQKTFRDFGSLPQFGVPDKHELERFRTLVTTIVKERKLVIFLYPTVTNLRNQSQWQRAIAPVMELCRVRAAKCVDIAQVPAWNESAYFGDGVHQTAKGTKILASILASAVN